MSFHHIKGEFPLLQDPELVYLDSGATTQKPLQVIEALSEFYHKQNANVHRGLYPLAERATTAFEEARSTAVRFLGAGSPDEIIFTSGTTASLNLLAQSFCQNLQKGDRILLTEMEHHSNLVPWQMAAKTHDLELDFITVDSQGRLDLSNLEGLLSPKTKLVSLTHVSNLLGTVNPMDFIIEKAHERGIPVAVDAAQSAGRIPLNLQKLDWDFMALSGHKIYGPTGIGLLYGKKSQLEKLPPVFGGGNMISSVQYHESSYADLPHRLEAGTPPIAQAVGMASAMEWLRTKDRDALLQHEELLTVQGLEKLRSMKDIELYGSGQEDQLGVISFNIKGIHSHDAIQLLSSQGIAIRAGHHCAQPLIRKLGVPSTLRVSFGVYNDLKDIDRLIQAIESSLTYFRSKGLLAS